jgi:hypothetical protein
MAQAAADYRFKQVADYAVEQFMKSYITKNDKVVDVENFKIIALLCGFWFLTSFIALAT